MEEMTSVTDDLSVWQMICELSVFENFQIISVIFVFFVNFTEFLLKSDDWTSGLQKILKRQMLWKISALTLFRLLTKIANKLRTKRRRFFQFPCVPCVLFRSATGTCSQYCQSMTRALRISACLFLLSSSRCQESGKAKRALAETFWRLSWPVDCDSSLDLGHNEARLCRRIEKLENPEISNSKLIG